MKRTAPLVLLFLLSATALSHPLPNLRFDRTVHLRLSPESVRVRYTLELNDWTMVLDGKDLVSPGEAKESGQRSYAQKYAELKAPLIADNLAATLDGKRLDFSTEKIALEPERDHVRIRYEFRADWKPKPGEKHQFTFEDQNFENRTGVVTLTLDDDGDGFDLEEVDEPVDLRLKSPLDLKPGDEERLRKASAIFTVSREPESKEGLPTAMPPEVTVRESGKTGLGRLSERGIASLFDTGYGLGLMLLLAFLFGAAHAFTPGHGKTLVAAYLVGERGTVKHAVVLGLVTTIAHTGGVILVAIILRAWYGERVPEVTAAVLQVVGGLLIAAVGLWLFLQRVRGKADHVHLFGDHHHHHDHDHSHDHGHHHHHLPEVPADSRFGWTRVILLGLGGGIIPCWDAVLLLLVAVSSGRLAVALPLLLAFSAGLAAILVLLGITVVLAHRFGGQKFGESRWFRLLPVLSAFLLIGLGIWFARDGVEVLFADESQPVSIDSRPTADE